ncbi:MAG TPA: aspartyl/asparaginyl beta-hydroxylase domain-containing protein [Solirubrobacteraceae bacterium]|nr:aspartyl/asparaginyl beta-hydroxylase domain-containing protein [Solirubrobacteraceae bacterium]
MTAIADATVAMLRAEGAERLPHAGGRTLLDHLAGTAAIVARWGQPDWLVHAALIHSVYGTDAYHDQLIEPARRGEIAAVAGARAERLAYLFCATPRRPLLAGTHRWAQDLPMRAPAGAPEAGELEPPTRTEADALLLLHMANLADQARAADGSPVRWLVRLRDLGELLIDSDDVTPPACVGALSAFGEEDESSALRSYGQAATADGEARTAALALAAAACPVLAEPCVWLAHLARGRGEDAEARSWAAHARARLLALGTAWDKRLSYEEWLAVIDELEHPVAAGPPLGEATVSDPRRLLAQGNAMPRSHRRSAGRAGATVPALDEAAGRRRFERYLEGLGDDTDTGAGRLYPDLPSQPWHDPRAFPLVGYLEARFPAIRNEILALDPTRFAPESERIGRTGDWDVVFLYERGRRHDEVCAACAVTAHGVDTHRTIRTHAGLIYVSRMRAGTHISAHRGPTNLRLRCHLGISVPAGDCAIRVGDRTEHWQEGRCLVFDDSFDHEAWNHTDEDRIVLIVDLWHPALSDAEVSLLEGLHAHTHRQARRLSRYWATNAAAARET